MIMLMMHQMLQQSMPTWIETSAAKVLPHLRVSHVECVNTTRSILYGKCLKRKAEQYACMHAEALQTQ